jgi:dienelactone hydrolase
MEPQIPSMGMSRTELVETAARILPEDVPIEPPADLPDAQLRRDRLLARYQVVLGKSPSKCDLQPLDQYTRRLPDHVEIKLAYHSEFDDVVSVYLLVPREGRPPFPAVVAHHQCNIDCEYGKEAVVGKVAERADQQYGLELVRRGFVVLAPDSKNCGERFTPGVREEGDSGDTEEWKHSHCWWALHPHLATKHLYAKQLYDSMRAIDYLESRSDLVDANRLGMIGHSLGAGTTFWTAAIDDRIKVAVTSCHGLFGIDTLGRPRFYPNFYGDDMSPAIYYHELLELIAPRALLATRGNAEASREGFPTREAYLAAREWVFSYGRYVGDLHQGAGSRIRALSFDGGHEFPATIREECYRFIEACLL